MNVVTQVTKQDIERALAEVEEKCGKDTANMLRAEIARLNIAVNYTLLPTAHAQYQEGGLA